MPEAAPYVGFLFRCYSTPKANWTVRLGGELDGWARRLNNSKQTKSVPA
jgi:hypothetical protein